MIRRSFSLRVLAVCFCCLAIPLLIDSFLFFRQQYEQQLNAAMDDLAILADQRVFNVNHFTEAKLVLLDQIIDILNLKKGSQEILLANREFKELKDSFDIDLIEKKDQQYKILASSTKQPEEIFSQKELLKDYLQHKIEKTILIEKGQIFLLDVRPLEKNQLLVAKIPLNVSVKELMAQEHFFQNKVQFFLAQSSGYVVAASDQSLEGKTFTFQYSKVGEKDQVPAFEISRKDFHNFYYKNQVFLLFRKLFLIDDYYLVAYVNKIALFSKSIHHFLILYLSYALLFLLGAVAAVLITQWMNIPYQRLYQAIINAPKTGWKSRYQLTSFGYDLNDLGKMFNESCDVLELNIQKEKDQRLKKEALAQEIELGAKLRQNLSHGQSDVIKMEALSLDKLEKNFFLDQFTIGEKVFITFGFITLNTLEAKMFLTTAQATSKAYVHAKDLQDAFETTLHDLEKDFPEIKPYYQSAFFCFENQNVKAYSCFEPIYQLSLEGPVKLQLEQELPCETQIAFLLDSEEPLETIYPLIKEKHLDQIHDKGLLVLLQP